MKAPIATLAVTALAASIGVVPVALEPAPRLLWNASASVPRGLYLVRPVRHLGVADLVVALPPEPIANFLAEGGYLPRGIPLVKHIVALPWQNVCRMDFAITVDGSTVGAARERDHRGRALPSWQGCLVLHKGEVFLMNWNEPASLDGRYFGPLPRSAIVGRAAPLWTFAEP
jgi:conjugative transfer signal peptidase TraF